MLAPRMVVKLTAGSGIGDDIRFYGKAGFKSEIKLNEIDTADYNNRVVQITDALESNGVHVVTLSANKSGKRISGGNVLFF